MKLLSAVSVTGVESIEVRAPARCAGQEPSQGGFTQFNLNHELLPWGESLPFPAELPEEPGKSEVPKGPFSAWGRGLMFS